jgi:hypothetical protein
MLQRSIKEEVRAIRELLSIIEEFIQEPPEAGSRVGQHMQKSSEPRTCLMAFAHEYH